MNTKVRDLTKVLDQNFLQIRATLLDLAAHLDRLDERGDSSAGRDRRLQTIHQAIEVLQQPQENRVERIQLLFSRPFDPDWRRDMQLSDSNS